MKIVCCSQHKTEIKTKKNLKISNGFNEPKKEKKVITCPDNLTTCKKCLYSYIRTYPMNILSIRVFIINRCGVLQNIFLLSEHIVRIHRV